MPGVFSNPAGTDYESLDDQRNRVQACAWNDYAATRNRLVHQGLRTGDVILWPSDVAYFVSSRAAQDACVPVLYVREDAEGELVHANALEARVSPLPLPFVDAFEEAMRGTYERLRLSFRTVEQFVSLSTPLEFAHLALVVNAATHPTCLHTLVELDEDDKTWTDEKNARRCELVDKEIDGSLTARERAELDILQQEVLEYRQRVAPLPLADVRELHQQLLNRARREDDVE